LTDLSVVIPVFNEADNIRRCVEEVRSVLSAMNRSFEVVVVDDGSTDRSFLEMKKLHEEDNRIKVVRLRNNFGQTAALSAGFDHAAGEVIVTLDGDLQNDPADIPMLVGKIDEGLDMVCGWRRDRKDPLLSRRVPSRIANAIISMTTQVKLHDYGCTLKAFRSDLLDKINLYGEMHRFIPAIAGWVGASIAEVEVNHRPRTAGRSKYGLSRTLRVILDLITVRFLMSYSTRPIHFFGLIGLISGGIGFFIAGYLAVLRLVFYVPIANRPLLLFAMLLILIGIQFISIGLLGEMLSRTYHESQQKPIYFVKQVLR
jgi:glycosyltransferase involved in cell wall biosynthesis